MPRDTRDGADRAELVDRVARDEVDIVVVKLHARIVYAFAAHLIQLGFVGPQNGLKYVIMPLEHTMLSTLTKKYTISASDNKIP